MRVSREQLTPWIETAVRQAWGYKAATRAYYIAKNGTDAQITGSYRDRSPSTVEVRQGESVPGSLGGCKTRYDISQVLAWLAKERRDLSEQLEWREQIPGLMRKLKA